MEKAGKREEGGGASTEQMDAAVNYVELLICCLFSPVFEILC